MSKRVVITGIGLVTPIGIGRETFFENLVSGASGIGPVKSFDPSRFPCQMAAEIKDFNALDYINPRNLRKMDRVSSLAAAAARLAVDDSRLKIDHSNRDRIGIILGVAYGCVGISVKMAQTIFTAGPRQANPILVPNVVMNAPAGHISVDLGIRGINSTINHNAASAETAIAYAAAEIARDRADVILAGGVDYVDEFLFDVLNHYQALAGSKGGPQEARPFDKKANGFILGEGAGVICLEALDTALSRGATIFAEILGRGLSSSPSPLNDWPDDPKGPVLSLTRALADAGIDPGDIDYINASANGAPKLDRLEARAIANVFGHESKSPLISSHKGALGESFSSGGIRTASTALSLQQGLIPPTLGLGDPISPLNFITGEKRKTEPAKALVTGFSYGGTYASLILGKI